MSYAYRGFLFSGETALVKSEHDVLKDQYDVHLKIDGQVFRTMGNADVEQHVVEAARRKLLSDRYAARPRPCLRAGTHAYRGRRA